VIDWIKAAGNYVEVHFNGRTKLLRMTLHQARRALPSGEFVQIHRSVLVNTSRIAHVDARQRTVRLADGATLTVGETFRMNLRR
jgi:two-component system LytT family response regulator